MNISIHYANLSKKLNSGRAVSYPAANVRVDRHLLIFVMRLGKDRTDGKGDDPTIQGVAVIGREVSAPTHPLCFIIPGPGSSGIAHRI